MVEDTLVKEMNIIICALMKTYTSGEFKITPEMIEEHDTDDVIQVTRNYEDNSYHLKIAKLGDTK